MTEKRFENRLNKNNLKFLYQNPVWDNEKEDALNVFEMIDLLNDLHEENKLVWNKIKKMESVLPYYLSCAGVRDFHSDIFEESLALTKHLKKRFQE